jgi:hypothetical protein
LTESLQWGYAAIHEPLTSVDCGWERSGGRLGLIFVCVQLPCLVSTEFARSNVNYFVHSSTSTDWSVHGKLYSYSMLIFGQLFFPEGIVYDALDRSDIEQTLSMVSSTVNVRVHLDASPSSVSCF